MLSWGLPRGLEAAGPEVDPVIKLPIHAVAKRLTAELQDNDVPLRFVLLPRGDFSYGAAAPLESGEMAARQATISAPLYIAVNELTQAQLSVYLKSRTSDGNPSSIADELRNHPAVGVSVNDAIALCKWLGPNFDLPSEQEWEWAARGAQNRIYPWGTESPTSESVRMRPYSVEDSGTPQTVSVIELDQGKSPEGVYHLLGNAAEWCRDLYAPGHQEDRHTTGVARLHVIRGGSYRSPAAEPVRVTWRANAPDAGANDVGVRIVCHPTPPVSLKP